MLIRRQPRQPISAIHEFFDSELQGVILIAEDDSKRTYI
jgi:hypothetical protein